MLTAYDNMLFKGNSNMLMGSRYNVYHLKLVLVSMLMLTVADLIL